METIKFDTTLKRKIIKNPQVLSELSSELKTIHKTPNRVVLANTILPLIGAETYNFLEHLLRLLFEHKCFKEQTTRILEIDAIRDIYPLDLNFTDSKLKITFYDNYNINEEAQINSKTTTRYTNFEEILKENTEHHVFLAYLNTNQHILATSKELTWELFFKGLIFHLNKVLIDPKENTFNKILIGILKALCERSEKDFTFFIEELKKLFLVWEKENIKEIFTSKKETQLNNLEERTKSRQNQIQDYTARIHELFAEIENIKQTYKMIKNTKQDYIEEISEYLINNPYLSLITNTFNEREALIRLDTPFEYYDEDFLDTLIEERDYTSDWNYRAYILFDVIFRQKKYKFWTHALISFNIDNFYTRALEGNLDYNIKSYYPHPHLTEFGCQGNHEQQIQKWIEQIDYIGCFEQIIAMGMNMNFMDDFVVTRLLDNLNANYRGYADYKTFEDPTTGTFYSFNEIIEKEMTT